MTIQQKIAVLIEYLKAKLEDRDWHGVSDAANDIRVLEAQLGREPVIFVPNPGEFV